MLSTPETAAALADHCRLEELAEQVVAAWDASDREAVARLWASLRSGLLAHLEAEEKHWLPVLCTSERDARVIIGEHRHLRSRLTELGVAIDLRLVRSAMLRSFVHELRAHARSEERLLYGKATAITSG
jgi:hypothetical protein